MTEQDHADTLKQQAAIVQARIRAAEIATWYATLETQRLSMKTILPFPLEREDAQTDDEHFEIQTLDPGTSHTCISCGKYIWEKERGVTFLGRNGSSSFPIHTEGDCISRFIEILGRVYGAPTAACYTCHGFKKSYVHPQRGVAGYFEPCPTCGATGLLPTLVPPR